MTVENPETGIVVRKPLSTRLLHWSIALLFAAAFATGYTAFDFDLNMSIRLRDTLFAIHRLSGIMAGLLLLFWCLIQLSAILRSIRSTRQFSIIEVFHIALGLACFALPLFPWIARGLNGRIAELYSIWPVFNLASHPTTDLAYKLLDQHKFLAGSVGILLGLHIAGSLYHRLILKDKILWAMLFSKN